MNSRLVSLLDLFSLKNRNIENVDEIKDEAIDYRKADEILKAERKRGLDYLRLNLVGNRIGFIQKENCCGCSATTVGCPSARAFSSGVAKDQVTKHVSQTAALPH